jgi:glyoxylase-like metal-dependent hydrolase (beta-lactamase superfamily II)
MPPSITIYKHQPAQDQLDILSGQKFQVEGATLRALHCPGHTTDHTAFILEEEGAMFTGDNVLGHGTAVFEDLSTYLNSLEMMKGMFSGRAYPGHGPVIDDGKARILEYIQHRQEREDQVLSVLSRSSGREDDGWVSMDIVKVIYKDFPENLHGPANGGVTQVLRKLRREEKVVEDPSTQRWRLKNKATLYEVGLSVQRSSVRQ